jgi:predicted metal-dependent phosphoesterase TrpH
MLQDFHLHTLVSDGDLEPTALLRAAASRGISHLAITDHDSLGAYVWREGEVFAEARSLGLELTVGIEMDADMDGIEVHLLGFGVGLDAPMLRGHLESVREARFERARREIDIVNGLLGPGTITAESIFTPGRETLMKPHFIHPILEKGLFPTYEEANAWYRKNVKAGVPVPKPKVAEAIRLVHDAGGWTALAHPGYYERDGMPVAPRLGALKDAGLDGVELDYPYHACSPHQFSPEAEAAFIAGIRSAAEPLGLRFTRGSDSHTEDDFRKVYGR